MADHDARITCSVPAGGGTDDHAGQVGDGRLQSGGGRMGGDSDLIDMSAVASHVQYGGSNMTVSGTVETLGGDPGGERSGESGRREEHGAEQGPLRLVVIRRDPGSPFGDPSSGVDNVPHG